MLFPLSAAVVLYLALLNSQAAAVICAICPSTIDYDGLTRTLTLTKYSTSPNIVQCNYDSPPISGFSPYCVYENIGSLYFTNTIDACPATTSVEISTYPSC